MPLDNTEMAAALTEAEKRDVSKLHRLVISYRRVTKRDATGVATEWVSESINLVHPDDPGQGRNKGLNGFAELGRMFKGNPAYENVTYTKLEAA